MHTDPKWPSLPFWPQQILLLNNWSWFQPGSVEPSFLFFTMDKMGTRQLTTCFPEKNSAKRKNKINLLWRKQSKGSNAFAQSLGKYFSSILSTWGTMRAPKLQAFENIMLAGWPSCKCSHHFFVALFPNIANLNNFYITNNMLKIAKWKEYENRTLDTKNVFALVAKIFLICNLENFLECVIFQGRNSVCCLFSWIHFISEPANIHSLIHSFTYSASTIFQAFALMHWVYYRELNSSFLIR